MNSHDNEDIKGLLKRAVPPWRNTELRRDLWPAMLKRLDAGQPMRVPWFDWALAALLTAALLLFPGVIPALLYHL
jgi:hypothetical protein